MDLSPRGWDAFARTPVVGAIESATDSGAASTSAVFHLFGNGSKHPENKPHKKKNTKKASVSSSVRLSLPACLDTGVYKIAALVNHFTLQQKNASVLYGAVQHTPCDRERDHLTRRLGELAADPTTNGLSANEIFHQCVKKADVFAHYKGPEWEKWFIAELECIRLQPSVPPVAFDKGISDPRGSAAAVKQYLTEKGVSDGRLICLVVDLCRMAGPLARPLDIVDQWCKVLSACSSHWCRPTLWWLVASTLAMYNVDGVTRSSEGGVLAPATCIKNWDALAITRLLQCGIFPDKVRQAVKNVTEYTLRDIAHERFDCEWSRGCQCLLELLQALDCPSDAATLREFYESKTHSNDGGEADLPEHAVRMFVPQSQDACSY